MSEEIDAWLEEYGRMPLIQVMMHPAAVKLIASAGLVLQPVDFGPDEPPTLLAVPGEALAQRLLAVVLPEEAAASPEAEVASVEGGPTASELEGITGFRRRPVTEDPR